MASGQALSAPAVESFFDADAPTWRSLYETGDDVFAAIHQLRHRIALDWVTDLHLPPGSRALEVGCGAGLASIEMARSGLRVSAVDATPAMVAMATTTVSRAGMHDRVTVGLADAHALPFPAGEYDLVVALGVLPWLAEPARGLDELLRVLRPGGWLVANVDNPRRLNVLLDPRYTPAMAWLRAVRRRIRHHTGPDAGVPETVKHTPGQFRRLLRQRGAEIIREQGYGFGPFTFNGHHVLRGHAGVAVHTRLQALADTGIPGLSGTGAQHLILARRG